MDIKRIAKNTGALTGASMLRQGIQFIVGILLARYLTPAGLGEYSAAYAFVNVFSYFNELGLSQLMVQEGSRDKSVLPVYFGNALLLKGVAAVVAFVVMLCCMGLSNANSLLVVILGIGMIFNTINQTIFNYYQTIEKMTVAAGYQFLNSMMIIALTLGVIYVTHQDVTAVTMTHLISYGFITLLLLLAIRKQIRPIIDVPRLPEMVLSGLPFGIQRVISSMFPVMSILILTALVSKEEIGIFHAGQNLVVALVFLPNTFAFTIYPMLFKLGDGDEARHQTAMEKVFKVMAAVGIPASLFMCFFSSQIINLLYKEAYTATAAVFAVLCWYFAWECLNYPLGDVMTTMNRQKERAVLQGVALGVLAGVTLWLYPVYGLMGAAWAVLLAEGFLFVGYYIFIRVKMYPIRIWRQLPSVLGASLVMLGIAYGIKSWHPLLAAGVAGLAYVLALLILDKDLRGLVKRIVGI